METSSLLNRHHHPPRPRLPHFLISPSSRSRFRLLPLRRSLGPISARRFDELGPRSFNDNDEDDDFDNGTRRRKKRRRRPSKQRRRWGFDESDREPSVLDQVIDSLWFFKVLRSYGWFLPVMLLSILVASGPKAFLMAFSIPLGFSFLTLLFNKISSWLNKRRKPESQEDDREESQPQKRRYRTWAPGNSARNSNSKFGGWDELIPEEEEEKDQSTGPDQNTDEPKQEVKSSVLQMRERELPLLSKLLVALFPFLASWTSLFR